MPNLFIVDLIGKTIQDDEVEILKHPNSGAVILFTRNFENRDQLIKLIYNIQTINPMLMIMVDHEGGIVQRFLRHGFRPIPAARVYGEMYDIDPKAGLELAKRYGEIMAKDLLEVGVDLSLAPVLDLHGVSNIIGKFDRAFHQTPEGVTALAAAFIEGMHMASMPSVGKHYPGHGLISADSHVAKPVYEGQDQDLIHLDFKPFVDLIHLGLLDALMPAHVTYPSIDPNFPAGFSEIWLKKILRDELQFNGVVMSDCLGMAGADIGDMHQRANQALIAGCDMLIVCNQSRELLLELLNSSDLIQAQDSLKRIIAFRNKMPRFSTEKMSISPYFSQTIHQLNEPTETTSDDELINQNAQYNKTKSV